MGLEIKFLAGHDTKEFLAGLEAITARLEKVARVLRAPEKEAPAVNEAGELEDNEPVRAPASKKAKTVPAAASFDDEPEAEVEDEEPAPKSKKSKKGPTLDDVNDACIERAGQNKKTGRAEVLAILKKEFGVKSVTDLQPSDYQAVIDAMKAEGDE